MFAESRLDENVVNQGNSAAARLERWADAPLAANDDGSTPAGEATAPTEAPYDPYDGLHLPPPGLHTTGTQLRRRIVTADSIALLTATAGPSLLQRVLRALTLRT